MSYPGHPKAEQIKKLLLEMRTYKDIALTLRVPLAAIRWQLQRQQMLRIAVTREERLWLAEKRGIPRSFVP